METFRGRRLARTGRCPLCSRRERGRKQRWERSIFLLRQYFCPISFVMKIFFFIPKQIFPRLTYFYQAKAEGKAGEKVTYRREWTSGGGKPEL